MGYIHVIFFFLFLSRSLARCERIQYRESRDARVCTRGHSMHSTENPRVNTRGPFCRSRSRCPRTRRYRRAQPPRIYCQSRVTRLSVTTAEDRRRYLIAMVNVPLLPCRYVPRDSRDAQRFSADAISPRRSVSENIDICGSSRFPDRT